MGSEKEAIRPTSKALKIDPSADVLHYDVRALNAITAPNSVAVIGASEKAGSVGRTIVWNLLSSPFGGTIYPINPKRANILGIKAYPNIAQVPDQVDLAVIVTPAPTVPGIIGECVDAGVKGAIIISAGFKETGPGGAALEQAILAQARRGRMRIIGPNCLGVMNPYGGLNATFAAAMARPGSVGFISQSGALCTAVLDWSLREMVGFSFFGSIGSMLDVGWGDLIYYLGDDPHTDSIVIYMETIGDARAFMSAAHEVALTKPIIVIKPGRTAGAARAAASHTGSLTGSDEVLEVAFRRSGVLRVNSINELFYMAEILAKQPRPKGPRLTIVTNAGGPGVLASDALLTTGGELAELSAETHAALNEILPAHWSRNNPVDVLGDAGPDRYARALQITAQDPNSDGLLVILTPQSMTDPTATAEQLTPFGKTYGKPIIASWMGGDAVTAGETVLNRANIPTFHYPDLAARMFTYMWRYTYNLRSLYETPMLPADTDEAGAGRRRAAEILAAVRAAGRTLLTEVESKDLLAAYGIPTVPTKTAHSVEQALGLAEQFGYPVVLKIYSETITHKTDVGGVQLNLRDADAVRRAYQAIEAAVAEKVGAEHFLGVTVQPMIKLEGYELIVGSSIDPQFGPVILFGTGGQLVEVFKDRALALPPLTTTLARRLMQHTLIYTALQGVRGRPPVDLAALEELVTKFSWLVTEQRWINELDINPLIVSYEPQPGQPPIVALDARVVVFGPEVTEAELPRLAILPYPTQYLSRWTTRKGLELTIRPIRPEDEPLMVKFHGTLSDRSVYLRYLHPIQLTQRIAHERLARICFIDYAREMALVAERHTPAGADGAGEREILGVGRLSKTAGGNEEAEFAILVTDGFQGHGLGTELLRRLIAVGRDEGLARIIGYISAENDSMQSIARKLGFALKRPKGEDIIKATLDLTRA
ncbi:MAG: bifunctional acetate--CoA ligase family protein/GNAT family N-acetyltransferase [Anaerolineales bacterium]|nr:bifunctional acetate--CoA ligase family protein/GNAT family N-acetyltransferase [Anaerolineales bacterium]